MRFPVLILLVSLGFFYGCAESERDHSSTEPVDAGQPEPAAEPEARVPDKRKPKRDKPTLRKEPESPREDKKNTLEAALRVQLKKLDGDLTSSDLAKVRTLTLRDLVINRREWLDQMPNVTKVIIDEIEVGDASFIGNMKNLDYLMLDRTDVTDIGFLSQCRKIRSLYLYRNPISDVSVLDGFKKLKTVDFRHNGIGKLPDLSASGRLDSLFISEPSLADISPLLDLKQLRSLQIHGVPAVRESKEHIIEALPSTKVSIR